MVIGQRAATANAIIEAVASPQLHSNGISTGSQRSNSSSAKRDAFNQSPPYHHRSQMSAESSRRAPATQRSSSFNHKRASWHRHFATAAASALGHSDNLSGTTVSLARFYTSHLHRRCRFRRFCFIPHLIFVWSRVQQHP